MNEKFDYQAYLVEKHSRQTAHGMIDAAVTRATGSSTASKKRIIVGEINEVYEVSTRDGQSVILRISRGEGIGFEQERWAIEQCRNIGVPVPSILLMEHILGSGEPLSICIETKLEGDSIEASMESLRGDQSTLRSIIRSAGAILARIHSVKTEGFGDLDGAGGGHHATWTDYMLRVEERRERLLEVCQRTSLDPALIDQAFEILRKHQALYENAAPDLLHGDYSLQHVFVKDGEITGIIDFEDCKGGDPAHDFAWWDFFYGTEIPVGWLKEGYARERRLAAAFTDRLHLSRLRIGLGLLDYFDRERNLSGVGLTTAHLRTDVQYFRL